MTVSRSTSFAVGFLCVGLVGALAIAEPRVAEIPDNDITPGVVASTNVHEVCGIVGGQSYSKRHRATPYALKREIRERDGCDPKNSEVDHRCMLALGCADVEANLWCQPGPARSVVWNYHDKDKLEVTLWEAVCKTHTMELTDAQAMLIAPTDWRVSYCHFWPDDRRCAGLTAGQDR